MGVLYTEGSTEAQASEAEKVMHLLTTVYPGHPWAVRVDKGIIFIRHLAFGGGNWGMNIKTSEHDWSGSNLQKQIVMAAGEWLERAGLKRGRDEGAENYRVEGVPERFQPVEPVKGTEIVIEKQEERTKPWRTG